MGLVSRVLRPVPRACDQEPLPLQDAQRSEPPVEYFTGPSMAPAFKESFDDIEHKFAGMQYLADHTASCIQLVLKLTKGVEGRILFDKNQFMSSSAARQCARMQELWDAGCEMRLLKPKGGGYASMHVKCWILDERVLLTGSVNLTHGGLDNNKEQLLRIRDKTVVQEALADFEATWLEAEVVTQELMNAMQEAWDKREEKKRVAYQGRPRSCSVSRSLSHALDDATRCTSEPQLNRE